LAEAYPGSGSVFIRGGLPRKWKCVHSRRLTQEVEVPPFAEAYPGARMASTFAKAYPGSASTFAEAYPGSGSVFIRGGLPRVYCIFIGLGAVPGARGSSLVAHALANSADEELGAEYTHMAE